MSKTSFTADYSKTLRFIEEYWPKIVCSLRSDQGVTIGLPNTFISPNAHIFKNDQYYWDSYFTILGLVVSGRVRLAKGMVENQVYLFKRFGIVPMRNRMYNTGGSQPPFLTSMIREVFDHTRDKRWLRSVIGTAAAELETVWMYPGPERPEIHQVYRGLSRYVDHYISHVTAEHESGWDLTSRFNGRCLDILPVDLNSLLYTYEADLARLYELLGSHAKARRYTKQASSRRRVMKQLFWNERAGFFFDYDWKNRKQMPFVSAAGFFPLWAGWATPEQARRVKNNLRLLEKKGGIVTTQAAGLAPEVRQWDYPNGWAPLQWICIKGLLNYGFEEEARRVAKKWLDLNHRIFLHDKKMWEKYDVVSGDIGRAGQYKNQYGFGWTNAVFVRLVSELYPEQLN